MARNKKKRKNSAPHAANAPPARPMPMDGRRHVSYEDLETMPTPPVPRHMVSYASSDDEAEEPSKADTAADEASPAEHRHRIMSRESDGTYDANRAQPRTDLTYGQVGAFPGLDTYQFAPFYGPANDGLDYLRMVRSEAREIPHIVTTKTRKRVQQQAQQDYEDQPEEKELVQDQQDQEDQDEEDYYAAQMPRQGEDDGYYSDGAYVSKPLPAVIGPKRAPVISPQEAYHDRLNDLFSQHRARCHVSPSADAVAALDDRHPISYPQGSGLATKEWKKLIVETSPLPAQLCSMDKWTIFRLLRLCERRLRFCAMQAENVSSNLAQWIWGLLGRLPESWQMRNEEVSKVRELGKFATWCASEYTFADTKRGRWDAERAADDDDDDNDWDYDEDGEEHGVSAEKSQKPMDADGKEGAETEGNIEAKPDSSKVGPIMETPATVDDPAEHGEIAMDMDTTVPGKDQYLSDMFAAKKQELQAEPDSSKDTPTDEVSQVQEALPEEKEQVPNSQTSAILDLIITVSGEFYGQRDLLWSRQPWQKGGE